MPSLYEIDEKITALVDPETGELFDAEAFDQLLMDREKKIENIALFYKNVLSDATAYKNEKDSFEKKIKQAENTAQALKGLLKYALGGEKFKTSRVTVSYRKSEQVVCEDITKVSDEYLSYKEPELKKKTIKEAIKSGTEVAGCQLVEMSNIQIK